MRQTVIGLTMAVALAATSAPSVGQDFYYCGDTTYAVTVSDTKITIQVDTSIVGFNTGQFIGTHPCLNTGTPPVELGRFCVTFPLSSSCTYATAASDLLVDPFVARVLPVYDLVGETSDFAVSDLVSVQFDELLAEGMCHDILASFGLHRVDTSQFRHNHWWCALNDTIEMSPLNIGNELHLHPTVEWASATMYARAEFQSTPQDTYYRFQYYLNNTGQTGGQLDADIDADLAWDISTGGARVCILDAGIGEQHPDLPDDRVQNSWDFGGWDPANGTPIGDPGATPGSGSGHGTASAGIIAAEHNGVGIAGISPKSPVFCIKISNDSDVINRDPRVLANAIHLAYTLGADVISNAWTYNNRGGFPEVYNAIRYVTSPCKPYGGWRGGVAVIFAAGNYANKFYGPHEVAFPANMKETIAVGAINKSNTWWDYSCYGNEVDLVAPTGLDADFTDGTPRGDVWTDDQAGDLGWNPQVTGAIGDADDHDYTFRMGGTSASCAMVAGITALLISRRPDLLDGCAPYQRIRNVLDSSAVDLGYPGKDIFYGYGRANAYRALISVIRGDLNFDGAINSIDLNDMVRTLFFNEHPSRDERTADLNCDGQADAIDLNRLIQHAFFNEPAPEPCFQF